MAEVDAASGEIIVPDAPVETWCAQCEAKTAHRRGSDGTLHCRRCVLIESVPQPISSSEDAPSAGAAVPAEKPRRRVGLAFAVVLFAVVCCGLIYYVACG
jgi:hypothetical protein